MATKNQLTAGQSIIAALGIALGAALFTWPPSFLPRWFAVMLGPTILWDTYYLAYRQAYKKEIAKELADPNSLANDKVMKALLVATNIAVIIISLLVKYAYHLMGKIPEY
jgi:hypothetical protein